MCVYAHLQAPTEAERCWAKFSIVDLAGAERSKRTDAKNKRQKEMFSINGRYECIYMHTCVSVFEHVSSYLYAHICMCIISLLILGRCLEIMRQNQQLQIAGKKPLLVPFRESKITRLFKDYLTGWGHTTMIATTNTNPLDYDETVHALNYAAVAKEIKIQPRINATHTHVLQAQAARVAPSDPEEVDGLLDEIYLLKQQLVAKEQQIVNTELHVREEMSRAADEQMAAMESMFRDELVQEQKALRAKFETQV
jgi:hypothetical protein